MRVLKKQKKQKKNLKINLFFSKIKKTCVFKIIIKFIDYFFRF
jgi:hypothetical protein